MYISNENTPKLFPDFFHFGNSISSDNRWIKLSAIIPWEKLDELYCGYFSENTGRPAKDSRLICGLLIVKYLKNLTDEELAQEFLENPYVQAFCGKEYFERNEIQIQSILSERRKRLGSDFFDFLYKDVANLLKEQKFVKLKSSLDGLRKTNVFTEIITRVKNIFR